MTDFHRSKYTISFQRVLVMHTQAIGSQIVTFYLVEAIDGLACLYGGIFFDGRWELRRDYTNSYIEFAITSPPTHRSPWYYELSLYYRQHRHFHLQVNLYIYSYFHDEPISWVVRLDSPSGSVWNRNTHVMWWKTCQRSLTSIRTNTTDDAIVPHRHSKAHAVIHIHRIREGMCRWCDDGFVLHHTCIISLCM